VFLVAMGKRLAITDRVAIQESFHHTPTRNLGTLILYIMVATLVAEGLGALILAARWLYTGRFQTVAETIYHAVFHSVSAFCNAGFALYPDNLVSFHDDPVVVFAISSLIVAGGIGFLAALDIKEYLQQTCLHRFWPKLVRERVAAIRPRPRLSLHTKFVLIVTVALLLIGTVSYYMLERNALFAQMPAGQAWMNSYFCAVTARTAGFNLIGYGEMGGAGLLCTMVLMFIGASPGSTGGGIKTSTFGVLLANAFSRWSGRRGLHAFKRTVSEETLEKAESIAIAAVALVILASSALMASETVGLSSGQSQERFLSIVFETISAFGTVGLSMGLTPLLTSTGKFIVALVMFIGRTGPLTLALAIALRRKRPDYSYAEENLMVG
ncbi:MAG: TrkH family potassium uptake protein, partial [Bryobacteraceae bacterium]